MKINQWTMGLAAVGVVSLASAVNAEEAKMNTIQTALSATTISGYVDTSLNWNDISKSKNGYLGSYYTLPLSQNGSKNDGINLNVVKLSIEKPMDESEWAAGYKVDLLFGPDAVGYNPSVAGTAFGQGERIRANESFGIKQAYVALRTPVGNGIDWKMGVFDTIVGYEVFESGNNPNFTRSWGWHNEPTQHTGLLGTYRVTDNIAVAAGVANTEYAGINAKDENAWDKTWLGSVALTAPEDMGFLSGSTLYAGAVLGSAIDLDNYYLGATFNTPVAGLKAGIAYDLVDPSVGDGGWAMALYLSYQATEKLSLHGRVDQLDPQDGDSDILSLTGTVQYDLWENVISRAEVRYDDANQADDKSLGVYLNVIYTF
jgi:hypothetical protein